jgi:AraC family transcriptional regulator
MTDALPGCRHREIQPGRTPARMRVGLLRPTTSSVMPRSAELGDVGGERDTIGAVGSMELAADTVIVLVHRAMKCLESDRRAALRCLTDASTLLGGCVKRSEGGGPEMPSSFQPGGLARWQARRALAYIEENLGSKIGILKLAALVSLSDSHFSRSFKRTMGLSPMAYVVKRRVERAKVMMIATAEQLTEIALACGFADQSHFTRAFRRMVGMSPSLWRRTNVIA